MLIIGFLITLKESKNDTKWNIFVYLKKIYYLGGSKLACLTRKMLMEENYELKQMNLWYKNRLDIAEQKIYLLEKYSGMHNFEAFNQASSRSIDSLAHVINSLNEVIKRGDHNAKS